MKIKLVGSLVVFAALLAVCGPAFAHHGSAAYDASHATTLKNRHGDESPLGQSSHFAFVRCYG